MSIETYVAYLYNPISSPFSFFFENFENILFEYLYFFFWNIYNTNSYNLLYSTLYLNNFIKIYILCWGIYILIFNLYYFLAYLKNRGSLWLFLVTKHLLVWNFKISIKFLCFMTKQTLVVLYLYVPLNPCHTANSKTIKNHCSSVIEFISKKSLSYMSHGMQIS